MGVYKLGLSELQSNLIAVQERIYKEAIEAGRDPDSVNMVVVTKGQPIEKICAVVEFGVRMLGENYVEEATPKIKNPELRNIPDLEWHMIGHIQSRKAPSVSESFDIVHSLDSVKLARRLDRFAAEFGKKLPVYLECNVSGEASKFGFSVWEHDMQKSFLSEVKMILACENLTIRGLMTMPPFTTNPEDSRKYFIKLRKLSEYLSAFASEGNWKGLSMGMSQDYHIAIQEGATVVRIGQAILGPRP